ncbi:hypothetical protein BH20ACI2_BH20ACI2_16030 [soil metagenome]
MSQVSVSRTEDWNLSVRSFFFVVMHKPFKLEQSPSLLIREKLCGRVRDFPSIRLGIGQLFQDQAGNEIVNLVPTPSSDSTVTSPP